MIRILLVDDQKTVRESLKAWLEPVKNFTIVGTASDGYSAIEQVGILKPDVVLIDMQMPLLNGVETTEIICQRFLWVKVIVLSVHDEHEYVSRSLQAGASGYLLKNMPREELIEAIKFVNRGYSQFAPGLVNKVALEMQERRRLKQESKADTPNRADRVRGGEVKIVRPQLQPSGLVSKPKGKQFYLKLWLLGNLAIWSVSLLYMMFKQPIYESKWAIALPASNSSASIDIPGVGQASSKSESPYNSDFADPRENYKYLAKTEGVLLGAADSVGMTLEEFGKPKVETPGNTTLIEFQIEARHPKLAQAKALALQDSLQTSLKRLRRDEGSDRTQDLEQSLAVAAKKLKAARQKLAQFQIDSGLSSIEQASNLTYNIEQLRKQKAEVVAQAQKTGSRLARLKSSLKIAPETAANALALQSDSEFKEYLASYSQASRELANLRAKFSSSHPSVVEKQAELDRTQAELNRRGELVLGQSLTTKDLNSVNADSSSSVSQRANLFQELVSLQAEQEGLNEQGRELEQQIGDLEQKLSQISQSGSRLQQLEKDVQLAQAVYSSNATKLELSQSETSASYPPVSIISSPSLPQSVAAPKKSLVMLGSLVASLLLSSGLYTLWLKEKSDRAQDESSLVVPQLPSVAKAKQNGKGRYSLPPKHKADFFGSDRD